MNKAWVTILLGIVATCCLAQDPSEKLFRFPRGNAAWTVDITYHGTATATGATDQIRKIEVTQVGDYQRCIFHWAKGKTTETWIVQSSDICAVEDANNGVIHVFPAKDQDLAEQMIVSFDVSSFQWIRENLLKDAPEYRGKKCLHYQGMASFGRQANPSSEQGESIPIPAVPCQAWIDKETLFPIALDDSSRLVSFTFQATPTAPLIPPQRFLDKLNRYVKAATLPKPFTSR